MFGAVPRENLIEDNGAEGCGANPSHREVAELECEVAGPAVSAAATVIRFRGLESSRIGIGFSYQPCYFCRLRQTAETRGRRAIGRGERDAAEPAIGSRLGGKNDTTIVGLLTGTSGNDCCRLSTSSDSDGVDPGAPFVGRA